MDRFLNAMKAYASALDYARGHARFGVITSFDPVRYLARVTMEPEGVLSGWLPVLTPWLGNGWGLAAPLVPGTQVLVLAQEGHAEHGVIVGGAFSAVNPAPQAPAGEFWLVHQSGSFFKLQSDGSVAISAPVVTISGNLVVTGDISDKSGAHGTLDGFRSAYDQHVHTAGTATTSPPTPEV
ncbi:MAG: phage baseplate assembly protein V [Acidobacteriia bacterium]|nr:phage baseplate assembly protein V [Methyloceanibacter sp.]MCL6492217.1 phage baseplate assembly protein V [Terriglobia bacterium]